MLSHKGATGRKQNDPLTSFDVVEVPLLRGYKLSEFRPSREQNRVINRKQGEEKIWPYFNSASAAPVVSSVRKESGGR